MNTRTIVVLGATAAILYLVWRSQQQRTSPQLVSTGLLDWAASPEQDAAYWALMSGGTPSAAGSQGTGDVTPGTMTRWLGSLFAGSPFAWSAPNAATNPQLQPVSAPPGATILPGPVPPQQPTPQSAVQSSSPWLPASFRMAAPVSVNAWAQDLTLLDPLGALLIGSGDTIDVKVIDSTQAALRG